jgi:hypothetical protein
MPGSPLYSHFATGAGWLELNVRGDRIWVRDHQIEEYDNSGNVLYAEEGHWAMAPEPSPFALLGLSLLGLCIKRAANPVRAGGCG